MDEALIDQRDGERTFAMQEFQRTSTLDQEGWATNELLDQRRSQIN